MARKINSFLSNKIHRVKRVLIQEMHSRYKLENRLFKIAKDYSFEMKKEIQCLKFQGELIMIY